jgi:hypothetical protein
VNESKNLEKLGALWIKKSKKGNTFLSGVFGEQRVVIFKVREKRKDNAPDYEIFKSEPAPAARPAPKPIITDDDLPF